MNELIHDVEESMRQERILALWKEYGPYLISGAILAVLLTGLMSGYRSYEAKLNGAQTAAIIAAVQGDDVAGGLDKITPSLRPPHRALAWLNEAGLLIQKDKKAEALAVYDKAAADSSLPEPFHSLAVLLAVRLTADLKPDADGKALIARLQPLIKDDKNAWRNEARVEAASIAAHSLHDNKQAQDLLAPIQNDKTAASQLKARAAALAQLFAVTQ